MIDSSGLPGRKCNVDFNSVQLPEYLKVKNQLLDAKGKILYWKDQAVYKDLSEKLNMQPKAIHQTLQRKSILIFGKDCKQAKNELQEAAELQEDDDFMECDFEIPLTADQRKNFEFTVDNNNRTVLKVGWTNTMFDILTEHLKLPCVLNFPRHTISNGEILTKAYCNQCGCSMHIQSQLNFTQLMVKVENIGDGKHDFNERRRLIGNRTEYFKEKLRNDKPYNVINETIATDLAEKKMLIPQRYPKRDTLKMLRFRAKTTNNLHSSAIVAVRMMKYLPEYDGVIKEIATDPLHIIFWSNFQVHYFHQLKKKQKICLSIDATGSLVSNASLLSDLNLNQKITLPHVFLYLIMIKNENDISKPIAQLLSADQHTRKILYFLQLFKDEFSVPDEITLDDSASLLKAVILAFTTCRSTTEYIKKCHNILDGGSENVECYVRLDIAHFVKNVLHNKVFKTMAKKQKDLYQCTIGLMIQCNSFTDMITIIENVLIVASIPFESDDLPTENSIRTLKRLIKTHESFESITKDDGGNKLDDFVIEETYENIDSIRWLKSLEEKVKKYNEYSPDETSSNIRDNLYVALEFIPYFMKLCSRIPLWTSVMNEYFKSSNKTSSSADVESQHNIIKNIIFSKEKLPIRLDSFMQKYTQAIKGDMNVAVAKLEVILFRI